MDMKKEFFRSWLLYFLISFVLWIGVKYLFCMVLGKEFDLLETSISAFVFSLLFCSFQIVGHYYSITTRVNYLESKNATKPTFKVACSSVIDLPKGLDFDRLKTEIADKWVIAFSDDREKVLKFRTKMHGLNAFGTATWMKYDAETGTLCIDYFPLSSEVRKNKFALKMQKEVEQYLKPLVAA